MTTPKTARPAAPYERAEDGAKLFSPSAGRNKGPIAAILATVLPCGARVLEIASGTGEHGAEACAARSDISWQPSDPDARARASATAHAAETGGRMAPALALDASDPDWTRAAPEFDALVCINMIHIAPWRAAEGLVRGAGETLGAGGLVFLYGPFLEGEATAPSNLDFDASLKARNPEWGVRLLNTVDALFEAAGFDRDQRIEMPANNLSLIYRKRAP